MDRCCFQQNIKWVLIPHRACGIDGVWECIIRYIRKILNALIVSETLNRKELIPFLTELEAMLNSRSLLPVIYDDKGQKLFTRNHVLLTTCFFQGNSIPTSCSHRRWARLQYMTNRF